MGGESRRGGPDRARLAGGGWGVAGPVGTAALRVHVCVGGGCVCVVPPVSPPVTPGAPPPLQAQQRPRRTPLQELRLQPGADRTSLTPLLRRLRLKVGVGAAGGGTGGDDEELGRGEVE